MITLLSLCREEVRLLKEELTEEYEADKQAALTQLSQQKELEMMAAREGWQRKVEDLLEQVQEQDIYLFRLISACEIIKTSSERLKVFSMGQTSGFSHI